LLKALNLKILDRLLIYKKGGQALKTINWYEVEHEGIDEIPKSKKKKHKYHIREGSILEGLLFVICLVGVIGILICLAQ